MKAGREGGQTLRKGPLYLHRLGMATGLCGHCQQRAPPAFASDEFSWEVKKLRWEEQAPAKFPWAPTPGTSDRTQTGASESTHLRKGHERPLAGCWLNSVGRKRILILRAGVYVCIEKKLQGN